MDNKNKFIIVSKIFNKEMLLYLVFGVLTTAVNLVAFTLLNKLFKGVDLSSYTFLNVIFFGKTYLLSNVIAWFVAVAFAFITNKLFVFESKSFALSTVSRECITFFGARVFSLLVEQLGLFILIDTLLQKELVSKIIISIIVVIINYFFSKLLIFKKNSNNT
ncbi:MAG: GtrA family protein [Oscillospiraceae bacterium]